MKHKLLLSMLCLIISAMSAQAQITLDTEHLFNIKYYAAQDGESAPENWQADDFDDSGWETYTGQMEFPDNTTFYFRASFYLFTTPSYCGWGNTWENCEIRVKTINDIILDIYWGDTDITQYVHQGKNTITFNTSSLYYSSGSTHSHNSYFSMQEQISNYFASVPKATCVTLSEPKVQLCSVDNTAMSTYTLKAHAITPDSVAEHSAITWSSSNPEIATVDNGIIKAIAAGDVTITASAIINGEEFSNQCNVNVKAVDSDAKVVYVETAGTLSTLLSEDEKDNTTKLVVAGNLNSEDIKVLRYMAGRDENGNMTVGMLEDLDMSLATEISSLGSDASGFSNCNSLKKIVLPKSITNLYKNSFKECKNLEEVVLQEGLTSISYNTFYNCSKLKSINIPSSVTSIDYEVFTGCNSLTKTEFASIESLCSISMGNSWWDAIYNSNPLYYSHHLYIDGKEVTDLVIPNTVTNIGEYLFSGCSNLTSVTFEEGSKLTSIGNYAFSGCTNVATINIPASVTSIGNLAFEGCSQTKIIDIPASVVSIGDQAFNNCTNLASVTFEAGSKITSIGSSAFANCRSLTTINIPEDCKLTTIGSGFLDGTQVKSFCIPRGLLEFNPSSLLPSTVESITVSASNRMFSAYEGSLYNHDGDSLIFVPRGKRTVTLSDKTIKIGENAFGNYTTKYIFSYAATPPTFGTLYGITPSSVSVYVPKGTVDTYQATNWNSFKLAEIVDKPTIYLSESNIEFYDLKVEALGTKSVYSSIVTPTGLSDATVTWSSSDTGIATVENGVVKAVAAGNATITASAIIDGETYTSQCNVIIKAIDTDAKVVYVETAGTLDTLLTEDEKANTKKLLVVGNINSDDVKVLRYMAGRDESGNMTIGMLEDLDMSMATGISSLGSDADGFRNCNSLKKIILPKSVTYLYYAFENCNNLEEIILQDGLTSICNNTFYGCSKLKSINIPSSVTNISSYAFYYCSSLVSINIPSSVNNIDYYTFGGCTNLNSVTFEKDSKLTSIGEYAFQGCSSLASIDLPASTISIGDWAFEDCTKLASVTFEGSKLTSIGNHAFRDCSQITSINLPASVISIGEMAFYNCSSLTEFNIPEDSKLTSVGSGMLDDTRIKSFFIPRGLLDFDPAQCAYEYETWGNSVYILPSALESITVSSSNRMFSAYDGSLYNYDGDSLIYVPRGQKTLSLSDKTTKIGANAFGDSTTKYIFSFAATPPTFGTDALNGITPSSVSVYVPKGTIDAYKATDWSSFKLAEIVDKPTIYLSESDIKFYKIKGEAIENKSVYATIVTPTGLSDAEVTWTSSASDVASVSSQGGITQGTVAGETTITASAVVDGQTIVSSLKVLNIETEAIVNVVAEESGSGLLTALGEDVLSGTIDLTISGTINSYDIMVIRNRMPKLKNLDMTDVKIVANPYEYYTGCHTEDNRIGNNMFREMNNLQSVVLPKSIDYIGSEAFSNCSSLRKVTIQEGVNTIDYNAFYNCSLDSIYIPKSVLSIGYEAFAYSRLSRVTFAPDSKLVSIDDGAFRSCYFESIDLPDGLTTISGSTFEGCYNLRSVVIPSKVSSIGYYAFNGCSSLRELRIPPMVESIGDQAFSGCNNITDVYVYIANARDIKIDMNTFSCWNTATLHIPTFSYNNYYWDTQWGQFYNKVEFSDTYDEFYTKNTLTLNNETGDIEGDPDATLYQQGGLVVEDIEQNLDEVELKSDANSGNGASLIASGEGTINASKLTIKINVQEYQWHFFCFPYDIPLDSVKYDGEYVWRQYDGAARSRREGGWQDLAEGTTKLLKGHGYIFQGTKTGELVLSVGKPDLKAADEKIGLFTYESETAEDASWNFVGNPYTSYYNIDETSYSAPITVWTNNGYEAYRPGDDDYEFYPYQAFFVQTPDDAESIDFKADARETYEGAQETQSKARARRARARKDPNRLFVNLELTADGDSTYTDKTRVVFNNGKSLDYENNCDAAKFFSESRAIQIYTVDNNGTQYSINERPIDNGTVEMGITVKTAGKFVLTATRMDLDMILVDNEMKCTHNLAESPYEFTADEGTSKRFTLKITDSKVTGIDTVDADGLNDADDSNMYDLSGRKINKPVKGVYIKDGVKVLQK